MCRYAWLVGALLLGAAVPPQAPAQQGLNNLWMEGYYDEAPHPLLGGVDIEFSSGSPVVTAVEREISFHRTNTNITDTSGILLFSTNGAYLANATGVQMQGGGG